MSEELTIIEIKRLDEYEAVIERGLKTFNQVGSILMAIRDERLYRTEYGTFEDYCRDRWGMTRMHAGRMIAAAQVFENVTDRLQIAPPSNIEQTRPLAKLPPEKQADAWTAAVEKAKDEGRKVTAKDVEMEVEIIVKPKKQEEVQTQTTKAKYIPPCNGMQFARLAIMKLSEIQPDDTERKQALTLVKEWIHENK